MRIWDMPAQHQKGNSDTGLNEYYKRIIHLAIMNKPMYLAWKILCIYGDNLLSHMGYPLYCIRAKKNGVPDRKLRENKKSPGEFRGFFRIQLYGTLPGCLAQSYCGAVVVSALIGRRMYSPFRWSSFSL